MEGIETPTPTWGSETKGPLLAGNTHLFSQYCP